MRLEAMEAISEEMAQSTGWTIDGPATRTLRRLLPDDCEWVLLPQQQDRTIVLLALQTGEPGEALFRVTMRREDRATPWALACTRVLLDPDDAVVSVTETGELSRGQEVRHRTWVFRARGFDEPIRIEPGLSGRESEDFAQRLAACLGWHLAG